MLTGVLNVLKLLLQKFEKEWVSEQLSEFQRAKMIGSHLCNKTSCHITLLLNIPQSAVSGIIPTQP